MSPTRRRLIITLVTLLLVALVPAAVMAAGGTFVDDDDSIFEGNIEWLAGAGVTLGCNPPTNDRFCPNDNVTRGQMAAFMQRFAQYIGAEDGTPAQADNAATADEATLADDARTVDGKSAIEFQPTTNAFAAESVSISTNGTTEIVSADVDTADGSLYLCRIGQSPTADVRVHASGNVGNLSAGEVATFRLADSSGAISNTTRWVSDNFGSFAIDYLYELIPGGSETFTLEVSESSGDTFSVNAVILVEVLSETRCKGTGFIVLPNEPAAGDPVVLNP